MTMAGRGRERCGLEAGQIDRPTGLCELEPLTGRGLALRELEGPIEGRTPLPGDHLDPPSSPQLGQSGPERTGGRDPADRASRGKVTVDQRPPTFRGHLESDHLQSRPVASGCWRDGEAVTWTIVQLVATVPGASWAMGAATASPV
jgi:hypothetical protein